MRAACLFLLYLAMNGAAGRVLINELQTAPGSVLHMPDGEPVGWVELYNAGPRTVDLDGMRLAMAGRQHHLRGVAPLRAGGHLLLRFVPKAPEDPLVVPFALPRQAGTLLLIAPDGATILDIFTYGDLLPGTSLGRLPDGASTWSRFSMPTPGGAAPAGVPVQHITEMPRGVFDGSSGFPRTLRLLAREGAETWYTLDGSDPVPGEALLYTGPITVHAPTVLNARSRAPASLAGPVACFPVFDMPADGFPCVSISMDPEDLWGDSTGIDTEGLFSNHSRKGRDWEREGRLQVLAGDSISEAIAVGIRVAGSGSRSKPKRSFKVLVRDRFASGGDAIPMPDGSALDEYLLRADATQHALLRNQLMQAVATQAGSHVDVQPARPAHLFLNGAYRGLYRTMHPKDADRIRGWADGHEVEVLEGPAYRVISGGDQHFMAALERLLTGAPLVELERRIELASLFDLAAFDLYTGRADHDLNVRCWRPATPDGRWRWVLYDMDLWPPVEENALERMCSTAAPEAPYLPQLLAHPELASRFLARFTALLATVLAPHHATALVDSLYSSQRAAMDADHQRWQQEMPVPEPSASAAEMRRFAQERPDRVLAHLSARMASTPRKLAVQVEPAGAGVVLVEGLPFTDDRSEGRFFPGIPLHLQAAPAPGMRFAGWKGEEGSGPDLWVDPAGVRRVRALFLPVEGSGSDGLQ